MNNNIICPMIWDNLCINTHGKNRLCCNSTTKPKDKFETNFENHWKDRERIKKENLSGIRSEECKSCWDKEDLGLNSLRLMMVEKYKNRNQWENFLNTINDIRTYPMELDLKLGNYCNLSCRMCNSFSSSRYQSEFKKIFDETGYDYSVDPYEHEFVQDDWYKREKINEFFRNIVDNGLVELKFTGGEPLIVDMVKSGLLYCIEKDKAKDIYLTIITNGTKLNDEWIEIFSQFKTTTLIISIDGVEDTYEYIRYPAKWNDVYIKLTHLSKSIKHNPSIHVALAFTLQIYNVLQIVRMIELARELGFVLDVIPLTEPDYLDVRNAPQKLKEHSIRIIDNIQCVSSLEDRFIDNVIKKISQEPSSDNTKLKERFKDISILKDRYRNQDFMTTEVYEYYDQI